MNEKEYELKRRSQNFNFWKFLLGTVMIGLVSHFINLYIQDSKIKLEVRKEETKYVDTFVSKYFSLSQKNERLEFLKFMSHISQSPEVRERYDSLHKYIENKVAKISTSESSVIQYAEKNKSDVAKAITLEKEIETGISTKTGKELTDEEIHNKSDEFDSLTSSEVFQKTDSITDNIEKVKQSINLTIDKTQVIKTESKEIIIVDSNSEWLKEGYFRKYDNSEYLAVNKLNSKTEIVSFQLRRSSNINSEIISSFEIVPGQIKIIETETFIYKVHLLSIGKAGKNPFTKAAIYDIIKVERNNM